MADVERTRVRPNKEKRQCAFAGRTSSPWVSRTNDAGWHRAEGEPWPCERSRVSSGLRVRSGLRSFEPLTRDGKARLYAKQDAKRKVRTTLHGGMGWVKTKGLNVQ